MDEEVDVVDDVNALLKLGVGDSYRLEHIKQSFIQNKTIWITDNNYLQQMREKYLTKHNNSDDDDEEINENTDKDYQNKVMIHCWKCGKKGPLGANFCMGCGSAIFDVGSKSENTKPKPETKSKGKLVGSKKRKLLIIGIPVMILIIFVGTSDEGSFDGILNSPADIEDTTPPATTKPAGSNMKCGAGTIYDKSTNSCILG